MAYVESYNEERKRLAGSLIASRSRLERRLGQVQREIDRLIQSYAKGELEEDDIREPLKALKAERTQLKADLESAEKPPEFVTLHPTALVRYRQQVEDLAAALAAARSADDDEPIRASYATSSPPSS